jgi:serine/threonine protein phosphatase PrpC
MRLEKPESELDQHYFGVCDGHGVNGHLVSGFLRKNLPNTLNNLLNSEEETLKPPELLFKTYGLVSDLLLAVRSFNILLSGSTAVTCFLEGHKAYLANVGDSRAIVVKKKGLSANYISKALTRDQKADDPIEKARILAAGGRVEAFKGKAFPMKISNLKKRPIRAATWSCQALEKRRVLSRVGHGQGFRRC